MKLHRLFLVFLLAAALALGSCSGPPLPGGGGGAGSATFSLTFSDAPPPNASILSFQVTITGVSVNPSTGSPVSLNPATSVVELTRLQSDSAFLGSFTVLPGTYSSITVAFASPDIIFLNQTGATIGGTLSACPDGAICEAKPAAAGQIQVTLSPALTLTDNATEGMRLDFQLNNAITFTGGNIGVDFTQPNILTAANLPQSSPLDFIEDFTGIVTAANQTAKTFTIHSATRGDLSASADSSTLFDNFGICAAADFSCVHTDQTLSVDFSLNSDGTLKAKEIDLLDDVTDDEIEGLITSVDQVTLTSFSVAVLDKVQLASGSLITSVSVGNLVNVNLQASPSFVVDAKGLPIPGTPLGLFLGATDASQLALGQMVAVRVKTFTAASGSIPASAGVDRVRLRFTRTTGTVSGSPASPLFNIDGLTLPPLFGLAAPAQVQTFGNQTIFENVADVNNLAAGNTVSIRALYFKNSTPAFCATKVRKR